MSYTLVKKDKPEAFDLGKGLWDKVFGREYGTFEIKNGVPLYEGNNFDQPFKVDQNIVTQNISLYIYTDSEACAKKICAWVGDDELFLINYWEEVEFYQESKEDPENEDMGSFDEEFTELKDKLVTSLQNYKITADIWS